MRSGTERLVCPRCGGNNLTGQQLCWRCKQPLAPPVAVHDSCPGGPGPGVVARSGARRLPVVLALLTVAALAAVVGALLLRPGSGVGTRQAELEALRDQLLRERAEASTSAPGATDPVEAEARRELERLYRRTGVGEPTTDASGQVRLRTGGSMDRAEYERYRARAGMR